MKVYCLMTTSDPYEPRECEGIYSTKLIAQEYMNQYLDKECKGRIEYREYLTKDDFQFGPKVFIDEVEVIDK